MRKPWWQQEAAIAWALILVFPLGLWLMWRYAPWRNRFKWGWTAFFALVLLVVIAGIVGGGTTEPEAGKENATIATKTALSPAPREATAEPTSGATATPAQEAASPTVAVEPTETLQPPTPTAVPKWEDGTALTQEAVRQALKEAKETVRSLDLKNPKGLEMVPETGTINVGYKAESALGETDLLTVGALTSFSVMRKLFANPNVQSVSVTVYADWTDQYGKTQEEETTTSMLTRQTVNRIVWDGLEDRVYGDNKLFFCISDYHYIHPAIFVRLEDKGCLLQ